AEGSVALAGAVVGGFAAAYFSHLVPAKAIRGFVIVYGIGLTLYFFWTTYSGGASSRSSSTSVAHWLARSVSIASCSAVCSGASSMAQRLSLSMRSSVQAQ